MKPVNSLLWGRGLLLGIVVFSLMSSCRKGEDTKKSVMDEIARLLHAEKRSGTLTSADNEDAIALNYNNGRQYILIDKLPGVAEIELPASLTAELITSDYGVIIKDVSTNRIWLLTNSDDESIRKFEAVKAVLGQRFESLRVFGTILVNPERS